MRPIGRACPLHVAGALEVDVDVAVVVEARIVGDVCCLVVVLSERSVDR